MYVRNLKITSVEPNRAIASGHFGVLAHVTYEEVTYDRAANRQVITPRTNQVAMDLDVVNTLLWLAPKALSSKNRVTKVQVKAIVVKSGAAQ